jgi:predicted P-loop ATPase
VNVTTTPAEVTTAKLAAVRAFIDAGYTLIPVCSPRVAHEHQGKPCKNPGKIPVRGGWEHTKYGAHGEAEIMASENYGVVLGAGDLVIDVDPRNFAAGDKPLARLVAAVGALGDTFTVRTGSGGLHIYLRKPADLTISQALRDFPGIEFKTAGRQVVGPGSFHAGAAAHYRILVGSPAGKVADAPAALLELLKKSDVPFAEAAGIGSYVNDAATQERYVSWLVNAAEPSIEGKGGDNNAFKVAAHGRDLGLPPATTLELMLAHWNERCLPPWELEELKTKVENAYKFAKGAVGNQHPAAAFEALSAAPPPKEKEPAISWVTAGPNRKIVKCFQNLINYMRLPAGGLHKIFAFNEFTGRIEFVSPAPWHKGRMPAYHGVSDHDLKLCKGYLATRHGFEASLVDIESAITNVAYHERFHPVQRYLRELRWDGVPRLDTWLRDYLGAVDGGYPDYLAAVSRKVICAAVARALRPGIKFDHVLVLEGAQDLGKSSVVEILGGEWGSDAPVDPHSRDTVDALQGRWIVEMAEMEVLRKTDEDALKAFITRKTDRVRLAYGRSTGEYPRQSIFIATKNPRADGTYLKDDTGNRRWWPVRCEPDADTKGLAQVNFKGLKAVRDQLFAEAVVLMTKRPPEELYMETAELKTQAAAVVGQRHAAHEWAERIEGWIAECDEKPETRRDFVTVRDVWVYAMNGGDANLGRKATIGIASVLRDMGWTQGFHRHNHRFQRGWWRPGADRTKKHAHHEAQPASLDEAVALL